ncbi:MAG: hypothetical protein FJ148_06040 [Deltaproteobacteria bacterium]|nr:hypothetical protein [Deltaproteobacteria bacterium]
MPCISPRLRYSACSTIMNAACASSTGAQRRLEQCRGHAEGGGGNGDDRLREQSRAPTLARFEAALRG